MSAPYSNFIPLAVLGASFLGSSHCVGMCGGLIAASGSTRSTLGAYHGGRLIGYLSLGAFAGWLGANTIGREEFEVFSWLATILLAFSLFWMGLRLWRGRTPHLFVLPTYWLASLHRNFQGHSAVIGALSALLPCGWLHGFVLAALATQSSARGAWTLFLFWLGTLPALTAAPWIFHHWLRPLRRQAPRTGAVLLMLAAVASLAVRASPLLPVNGSGAPQFSEKRARVMGASSQDHCP